MEIRHRDGKVIPVLYNASIYRDTKGDIAGVFAAARDITKRKEAEEALRKNEKLLAEVAAKNEELDSFAEDIGDDIGDVANLYNISHQKSYIPHGRHVSS